MFKAKCLLSICLMIPALLIVSLTACEDNTVAEIGGGTLQLTGTLSIVGSYNVGSPFVADTNGLSGIGALNLQWLISDSYDGNFTAISGADGEVQTIANVTNAAFTPNAALVRKYVKVTATRAGFNGSVSSVPYMILAAGLHPVVTRVGITHPYGTSASCTAVKGETLQLSAEVFGTDVDDVQRVIWAIITSSAAATTIDQNGRLVIAASENNQTITVRATSIFNTLRFAELTVYISTSSWGNWKGDDTTDYPAVRRGANVYFIAPDGSDSGAGTIEDPWLTIPAGKPESGGVIYFRGGTYNGTPGAFTVAGNRGSPTLYSAYPPDLNTDWNGAPLSNGKPSGGLGRPVFDFQGRSSGVLGQTVSGNWIHVYGIDVCNTENTPSTASTGGRSGGLQGGGEHCTIEFCRTYNTGSIATGGNYSLVLNCDIFQNATFNALGSNMNHDGGGMHGSTDGVVRYGNRVWAVTDDGWDTISTWQTVVIDSNWHAYSSHYYPQGTSVEHMTTSFEGLENAKYNFGRGNGFKMGGYNMQNALNADQQTYGGKTYQVARFNMATGCSNAGFTTNFTWGGGYFAYNTAWNNHDNFDLMRRKGTDFTTASSNTTGSSRVINAQDLVMTGNVAIPGGSHNTGFNVGHLDFQSGNISSASRANNMQEPHGRYESQIWNNSWVLVDNGASKSHGEANWIEGIMQNGSYTPAPDLWVGEPWPTTIVRDGKTWNLRAPSQLGGPTYPIKDLCYFIQGSSGPRGTKENPKLAWDEFGYWKYWDDKHKDVQDNGVGFSEVDVMSFDEKLFFTPRKKNGDLPDIAFLRPVPGSVLDGLGYTARTRKWSPKNNSGDGGYDPAVNSDLIETADSPSTLAANSRYRFYLWKFRAGANPTLADDLSPL